MGKIRQHSAGISTQYLPFTWTSKYNQGKLARNSRFPKKMHPHAAWTIVQATIFL